MLTTCYGLLVNVVICLFSRFESPVRHNSTNQSSR